MTPAMIAEVGEENPIKIDSVALQIITSS